jgi:hypothetical protein
MSDDFRQILGPSRLSGGGLEEIRPSLFSGRIEMDKNALLLIVGLLLFLGIVTAVALMRWVFRINTIVAELEKIRKAIERGGTGWKDS